MTPLLYLQQYGNVFEVRVTTTVPVNAWEGRLLLPTDLRVTNVYYGAGIGTVWRTPPAFSDHYIGFAGGTTAPFAGDGLLFRFTAAPPVRAAQLISFDAARTVLYAADGQGTAITPQTRPLTVNAEDLRIVSTSIRAAADGAPPEAFEIALIKESQIFGGAPAIIFTTTDADSGIDHYEIEEHTTQGVIAWHRAESPYLVDPATSMILVKAVDRSGNFRTESIVLRKSGFSGQETAATLAVACLVGLVALYFIYRWHRRRRTPRGGG